MCLTQVFFFIIYLVYLSLVLKGPFVTLKTWKWWPVPSYKSTWYPKIQYCVARRIICMLGFPWAPHPVFKAKLSQPTDEMYFGRFHLWSHSFGHCCLQPGSRLSQIWGLQTWLVEIMKDMVAGRGSREDTDRLNKAPCRTLIMEVITGNQLMWLVLDQLI